MCKVGVVGGGVQSLWELDSLVRGVGHVRRRTRPLTVCGGGDLWRYVDDVGWRDLPCFLVEGDFFFFFRKPRRFTTKLYRGS